MSLTDWLRKKSVERQHSRESKAARNQENEAAREREENLELSARLHWLEELKQKRERAEMRVNLAKDEAKEREAIKQAKHEEYLTTLEGKSVHAVKSFASQAAKFLGKHVAVAAKNALKPPTQKQAKHQASTKQRAGTIVNVNVATAPSEHYAFGNPRDFNAFGFSHGSQGHAPKQQHREQQQPQLPSVFGEPKARSKERQPRLPTLF